MHQRFVPRWLYAFRKTASPVPCRPLALASLLLLAACGGGDTEEGQMADSGELERIDACNLLTPTEVGEVIGVRMAEPTKRESSSDGHLATSAFMTAAGPTQ